MSAAGAEDATGDTTGRVTGHAAEPSPELADAIEDKATPGSGATREFARASGTAYWIFVLLALVAMFPLGRMLVSDALRSPFTVLDAVIWALWGLLAYGIVTRADLNWSVPGRVRFAAVAWGVLCMAYSSQLVEPVQHAVPVSDEWSAAVHAPLPEEAVKLLGVVLIAFVVPPVFGRSLGALTVGMVVGLGFTIIENLGQTNGALETGSNAAIVEVLLEQGVYGAPWAHAVFTGVAALGVWCVVAFRPLGARILAGGAFFVLALFLHFLQDALGPFFGSTTLELGYGAMLLALLLALVIWTRWLDRRWFRTLTSGGLPPVLDAAEAASLLTRRTRRRARGTGAAKEVQKTQLCYANAVSDGDDSTAEDLLHRERLLRIGALQGMR